MEPGRCGTTAAPSPSSPPHSVPSDSGSTLAGLACLHADLCRSLGGVSTRPCARSAPLFRWPGGAHARVWHSGKARRPQVLLSALWPGPAPGSDALEVVVVLAVRQRPGRPLGESGEPGPPRGGHLSAQQPDGAGHVPPDLLPARGGRGAGGQALRGTLSG